jgi:hypothetical protein
MPSSTLDSGRSTARVLTRYQLLVTASALSKYQQFTPAPFDFMNNELTFITPERRQGIGLFSAWQRCQEV